jgi:excisionase family DNA binding protein
MQTAPDAVLAAMLSASLAASPWPAIIDAEQAATLLHCSKGRIELLAERGQLPATKFGRGWIFVTAQLIQCALARCAENVRSGNEIGLRAHSDAPDAPPETQVRESCPRPVLLPMTPRRGRGRPRTHIPDAIRRE